MPARSWGAALVVCSVAVGAPPLIVEPPLVADFDEWEAVHKSNRRGASPELLNHDPHAIDATRARWRGVVVYSARFSHHGRVLAEKGFVKN